MDCFSCIHILENQPKLHIPSHRFRNRQAGVSNLTIFKAPNHQEPFEKQRISGLNSRRMDQVGLKRFEPCPAGRRQSYMKFAGNGKDQHETY